MLVERGGFIALPLLAIAIAWARAHWREPLCKALTVSAVIVMLAAIGPYLQIGGIRRSDAVAVMTHVPLLEHALPARLMLFPPLALAIIVALWIADPENSRRG